MGRLAETLDEVGDFYATNGDLEAIVAESRFRRDLYYWISVPRLCTEEGRSSGGVRAAEPRLAVSADRNLCNCRLKLWPLR